MNFNENNHETTCPDHGHTRCIICHVVAGECDSGGCTRKATRKFYLTRADGSIATTRNLCGSDVCHTLARQAVAGVATLVAV